MPGLFDEYSLKGITLRNRITVSPMCQYSAVDGIVNDWHITHLGGLARGGAGLVVVEAAGVSPEARITPACLGLWNDGQAEALARVVPHIASFGAVPGIQLAHAGRLASALPPWEGDSHIPEDDPKGWEPIGPSAIARGGALDRTPRAMTTEDIQRVVGDFVSAAVRARDAGFQWLLLHFAHGYLVQSFLSKHSNRREDSYGGSFENRSRLALEILRAVRAIWPEDRPLAARLGVIEFDGHEAESMQEAGELASLFKSEGLDLIDVSMGFTTDNQNVPWGPALLAPYAQQIRNESGLPAMTSWCVGEPEVADALIRTGQVDLVAIGRPLLANPHWPYAAAQKLGFEKPGWATLPAPYAHWLDRYRVYFTD